MDFELFKRIVEEATQYGPRSFSLHLFGEPLLYPKILEAIGYIKSQNRRHTVLLTTNGTLLNKFAKELLKLRVDRIIWSWRRNNFTPDTIKVLKKIGLVRLLIEETPKEDFEEWRRFPRVEIKHLHNYGGNIDVSKWGVQDLATSEYRYPCYHLWLAPAIRWNGEITICCNDPNGLEVIGNFNNTKLGEAWRGERISRIRESHMNNQYNGLCKNCDSWKAYPNIFFKSQCTG